MRTNRFAVSIVLSSLFLCGAGCLAGPELTRTEPSGPGPAVSMPAEPTRKALQKQDGEPWHRLADGVEKTIIADDASGDSVTLFRFAAGAFSVRLLSSPEMPKSVAEWAKTVGGKSAVINGTYFNDDRAPSGFVAIDGKRVGSRSFDLDKSGLLLFSPEFRIANTKREKIGLDAVALVNAAQSYPFYVLDGRAAIGRDSGQVSRRSFIGQDEQGRTYLGVVPNGLISLYALMGILMRSGISWRNVLSLDGGPSTGLVSSFGDTADLYDSFDPVPNVIVVTRK